MAGDRASLFLLLVNNISDKYVVSSVCPHVKLTLKYVYGGITLHGCISILEVA